jgi:hypothetical protein
LSLQRTGKALSYSAAGVGKPIWTVSGSGNQFRLRSDFREKAPSVPFQLKISQKANHATLLGVMRPGDRSMPLPCVLHLPDMGSVRITCNKPGRSLIYDARRYVPQAFVQVEFPAADSDSGTIEYTLEVIAIHPKLGKNSNDPIFDGYKRNFLNIFQVNPRLQMLANNASSDIVPFTVFTYSAVAAKAPPLAKGLTCMDMVRMTLDQYVAGVKGYGQHGYGTPRPDADIIPWVTPYNSSDTYPSLAISACDYVLATHDWKWAKANYAKLAEWTRSFLATDKDGNGLIEYPASGNYGDRPVTERRPANWWDTINFGHEDAYSNALAYRALTLFAQVARKAGQQDDARFFASAAARLRGSYSRTFMNPATGVLAGWKSVDGQLHDYYFTFVNGVAITYGLLEKSEANQVMDRLLAKMKEVAYTNFSLGLPGNLVPVKKGDYVFHGAPPEVHGEPRLEDGSDGFQYYENGGATGCFAYFTVKALYSLGRTADARSIYLPMLGGYSRGEFQGFCADGKSRDWRDWKGGCHGYEGLLVDNYMALIAVEDELAARRR